MKQTSKSTKSTKCELSDISESNEIERNSSSSDIIKSKPVPVKKQNKTMTPPNSKAGSKVSVTSANKQAELILNIVGKSSSSLLSTDEDRRTYIRDYIEKLPPMDSNDLTNPPNTVRASSPETNANQNYSVEPKKKGLEVQMLPPLDIKRSLITQKLPDVAIESIEDFVASNLMSSDNVKYIQMMHDADEDLPKEQTPVIVVKPSDETKSDPDNNQKTTTCADVKIEEIYIAPQQSISSSDDIINEMPTTLTEKLKDVPKERGTVNEELNLDIDNLPSVRTLKEIQSYLEQKCALIRSRLAEESQLKTGETLSLRYKLSQPPLWLCSNSNSNSNTNSKVESESKSIIPEQNPKAITLSPLKTYSSIKSPLSPLQKYDKSQQMNASLICKLAKPAKLPKTPVKTVNKSLQVSISENTELPIARKDNACYSSQLSIETSNKDIHEMKESFNTPSLKSPKTVKRKENSDSIREITVSPQKDDHLKGIRKDAAINTDNTQLVEIENQVTNKDISTQFDNVKQPVKRVSFDVVTKQFSLISNENKETQISQLDSVDEVKTESPVLVVTEKKKDNEVVVKEVKKCKNETIIKEKEAPPPPPPPLTIVRYMQSNATQTVDVKNKFTSCNIQEETPEITPLPPPPPPPPPLPSGIKETKECCTQYSPILDATQYKNINSFKSVDRGENEEQNKQGRVHYSSEERRHHDKSKMQNRRTQRRHKMCSTPVSQSSVSTAETVPSLSDGEVKLSCECSTSIGEIHLCRFANNIRNKVRILKQNPQEVLRGSLGERNVKMERQHKYNDNWFAYYVTKTESSSEHGTGSNLSSIKSNIETETE